MSPFEFWMDSTPGAPVFKSSKWKLEWQVPSCSIHLERLTYSFSHMACSSLLITDCRWILLVSKFFSPWKMHLFIVLSIHCKLFNSCLCWALWKCVSYWICDLNSDLNSSQCNLWDIVFLSMSNSITILLTWGRSKISSGKCHCDGPLEPVVIALIIAEWSKHWHHCV